MTVFISWSGKRARELANALYGWLPDVLPHAEPWVSDKIFPGDRFLSVLQRQLRDARFGIICVTPENAKAPWLHYEAGAMAERMQGKCCPFLLTSGVGLVSSTPLAYLQCTNADRDGTFSLVSAINEALDHPIPTSRVEHNFDREWPVLAEKIQGVEAMLAEKEAEDGQALLEQSLDFARVTENRVLKIQRMLALFAPTLEKLDRELK